MFRIQRFLVLASLLNIAACSSLMMTGGGGTYSDPGSERSATEVARDTAITAEIKARHLDDPVVSVFDVGVRTVGGRVTLTGAVGSYEARNQAYRLARQVDGVTAVINQIRVEDRSK